ncbi:ATP-dependent Clp protease ATP-binding subunit ClpA, partial [Rhodospirillaceae bacterium AH-315-P19]|nr:ATP-dependent Clp protease ATP-binding subunit ClpA [Rhodospirillaceae bacterium AH-315-P19]
TPEVMTKVVDKFVMQLEAQLADRGVTIALTEAARAWLAKKGYDEQYGARPLARVIQEKVKKALSEELLFGLLEKGGHVRIDVQDEKLAFTYPEGKDAGKEARKADSELVD